MRTYWFHAVAAAWIAAMLLAGFQRPAFYESLLEEDRAVEWATVALFAAAGIAGLRKAVAGRGVFDGLVALLCLAIAGEEFSWGQRLIGFDSPEFFLAANYQQELTLHNLPQAMVRPKWILIAVLAGYGCLLPLMHVNNWLAPLRAGLGATAPPERTVPWFTASILILWWYPHTFTSEWVECLAGALFLASVTSDRQLAASLAAAALFGVAMSEAAGALERRRDTERVPCAAAQAQALVDDIVRGSAATAQVWERGSIHKRVWTAVMEGYLDDPGMTRFKAARCGHETPEQAATRRRYGIDPWGSPLWIDVEATSDDERVVTVYSFGSDRRRDNERDSLFGPAQRDIMASDLLRR